MNSKTSAARDVASSELYGTPSFISRSAHPITPQTYFTVSLCNLVDLVDRIVVHIYHVIEKPDRRVDDLFQPIPMDHATAVGHPGKVDRSQVARFIRKQRLFTARVCRFHFAHMRGRVILVYLVDKDNAGITVFSMRMKRFS